MGKYICKLEDMYFLYSDNVDAPVTYGMTLDELKVYYKRMYGEEGMLELPARLARVEKKGTSSLDDDKVVDVIWLNRAGKDESRLTLPQMIQYLRTHKKIQGWRDERPLEEQDESQGWTMEMFMDVYEESVT